MSTSWTPDARLELQRLLEEHHARLVGTGVDADEVVADLRRHVEIEIAREAADGPVDAERVRAVAGPLCAGETGRSRGPSAVELPSMEPAPRPTARLRWKPLWWFLWVVLPLIAVGFEWYGGPCAELFADPLRTWLHVVAIVATAGALAGLLAHVEHASATALARWASVAAFAAGIGLYFSVLTYPAPFIGVVGLAAFGLGLIPMSPLLQAFTAAYASGRLRRIAGEARTTVRVGPMFLAGFLVVFSVDARWFVTGWAVQLASDPEPAAAARGLAWLRSPWTSEDALLEMCVRGRMFGGFGLLWDEREEGRTRPWIARELYFSATGRDYFADLQRREPEHRFVDRSMRATWIRGTQALRLESSRLDGLVSPDALVGYVEWTAVVRNPQAWNREGRATLQLPPGAVVSRVTLWINGEEREAAFGGRAQTTRAYEAVTQARRDPLLVTSAGPDRVALRFFPVPRNGTMKFRIGISFPLVPSGDAALARTTLPRIVETDLTLPDHTPHEVWYEAHAEPVELAPGLVTEPSPKGETAVRGTLPQARLAGTTLAFRRNPAAVFVAPLGDSGTEFVRQELRRSPASSQPRLLVLDGSPAFFRQIGPGLVRAFRELRDRAPLSLVVALEQPLIREFANPGEAAAFLERSLATGRLTAVDGIAVALPKRAGFANDAALAAAVRRLAGTDGTVLWIHGVQPNSFNFEPLLQVLTRREGGVRICESAPDAAAIADWSGVDERLEVLRVAPESESWKDLLMTGERWSFLRERVPADAVSAALPRTLRHVARLWAAEEAMRRVRADFGARDDAMRLAIEHQIVTPLTGAVVLETAKQYADHRLKPADANAVPVVPEPQTYAAMLSVIGGLIVWRRWIARRPRA